MYLKRYRQRIPSICILITLLILVRQTPASAQGVPITPQQLFSAGTAWQRFTDNGCYWVGQEPEGSRVYAWEENCNGVVSVWGYDLDARGQLDVVLWLFSDPQCGGQVMIRAWQWFDGGSWAEYVAVTIAFGNQGCPFTYYSSPSQGAAGFSIQNGVLSANSLACKNQAATMRQRRDNLYRAWVTGWVDANRVSHPPLVNSQDRLAQKKWWHQYNRANLTFNTCQRIAAAGPSDYHNSR